MLLKVILIIIVISCSILAITGRIPTVALNKFIIFLSVSPLILIYFKRNLLNGLLIWFYLVLFRNGIYTYKGATIILPMLPDISLDRLAWLCIFVFFIVELGLRQREMDITSVEIAMICMCMYILFSSIYAGTFYVKGEGLSINVFLSNYIMPFSVFFLAKNMIDDEQKVKKVFMFLAIIGLYLGLTGIFENFGLWMFVFPKYISAHGIGMSFGHARGPFLSAGQNGMVLSMIFFVTVCLLINTSNKRTKVFLSVTIVFMLAAILFTYQRATWLGLLIASLASAVFLPQARKIVLAILLAVILVGVTVKFDIITAQKLTKRAGAISSVYGRMNLYSTAANMFLDKPIFGFGFNAYKKHHIRYIRVYEGIPYMDAEVSLHDTWASILVELGLVGFATMWFIFLAIFKKSLRLYYLLPDKGLSGKTLVAAFWGAFIAFLVMIEISGWAGAMFPVCLFFLLAGIIVGKYQRICQGEGIPVKK